MKLKNSINNIYKKTGILIDCEIDTSGECGDLEGWYNSEDNYKIHVSEKYFKCNSTKNIEIVILHEFIHLFCDIKSVVKFHIRYYGLYNKLKYNYIDGDKIHFKTFYKINKISPYMGQFKNVSEFIAYNVDNWYENDCNHDLINNEVSDMIRDVIDNIKESQKSL
jgi:hypothetical protein